jgi:serine/threonine protein kinase
MGAVYVGFDEKLQRKVALKAIRSEYRLNQDAKARLLREARILSQLRHPNICIVHDYIESEDNDFVVLELIEGQSLRAALEEGLSQQQKTSIARQLLEALVAMHSEGVIHRDLKPENVMITRDGVVKVLDFGLARAIGEEMAATTSVPEIEVDQPPPDLVDPAWTPAAVRNWVPPDTSFGTVVGTLGYMSPEQARGEPATVASDMYSLGLILQELLTGEPPFEQGLTPAELVWRAARGVTLDAVGLAPELTDFIDRLKALAPAARPSSVNALARLRRTIDRPRPSRRRVLVAPVSAVVALLCGALAFQSVRATRLERRAEQEAASARQVSNLLIELVEVADPTEAGGSGVAARELLDKVAARIKGEGADQLAPSSTTATRRKSLAEKVGIYRPAGPVLERAFGLGTEEPDDQPDESRDAAAPLRGCH